MSFGKATREVLIVAASMLTAISLLGGCGDGEDVQGGRITIGQAVGKASLDPAFAHTGDGSKPAWATEVSWLFYTPLLTYRHEEGDAGTELIPGLAADLPEVSANDRTYTLTLREDIAYSDGRDVEPGDFEAAVKRSLRLQPQLADHLGVIHGVDEYVAADGSAADISGIDADTETGEIKIRLESPNASFPNVLAMPPTAPLPPSTPLADLSSNPPPGVGPYEIVEATSGGGFVARKSRRFETFDIPDIPTGNVDRITAKPIASARRQTRAVLNNRLDYMQEPPPTELKPTIFEQASDRYAEHATGSTFFFFFDHARPPFDDPRVRAAVNRGIDRPELASASGGELVPGCAFLPPGIPGYDEALDVTECPYGDPTKPPDVDAARELVRRAGARGARVDVWGSAGTTSRRITVAYAQTLRRLGLRPRLRIVPEPAYARAIGRRTPPAQTGLMGHFQTFPHPLDFYRLVDGRSIRSRPKPNLGGIDDPRISDEIDRLRLEPDLESVAADWSQLDAYLVSPEKSHIAPIGHRKLGSFFSERMDTDAAIFHPVYFNDYSSFALKEGEER